MDSNVIIAAMLTVGYMTTSVILMRAVSAEIEIGGERVIKNTPINIVAYDARVYRKHIWENSTSDKTLYPKQLNVLRLFHPLPVKSILCESVCDFLNNEFANIIGKDINDICEIEIGHIHATLVYDPRKDLSVHTYFSLSYDVAVTIDDDDFKNEWHGGEIRLRNKDVQISLQLIMELITNNCNNSLLYNAHL